MEHHNYVNTKYSVSIELGKTPGEVFKHLIDLSKWWPEDFVGENVKPGSEFVLKTGDSHYSKNKVIEFVPGTKIAWVATESIRKTDGYDWTGSKFIFELTPKGNTTEVRFTYDGVVFENEFDKLVQICDMTVKDMFYNFIINGKAKQSQ